MLEYCEVVVGGEVFYYIGLINHEGLLFGHDITNKTGLSNEDVLQIMNKYNVKIFRYEDIEYYGFKIENDAKQAVEELNFIIKMVS
jgi:hypothetical protein